MIRVNNINGSPESKPSNYYAIHSDNAHFYFFETKEEQQDYFTTVYSVWDKEIYIQQVNDAHNALFRSMYLSKDYLSIGEIPIWFTDDEFGEEAIKLSDWWIETCKLVSTYLDTVTEETAISIDEFIQTLPIFNA